MPKFGVGLAAKSFCRISVKKILVFLFLGVLCFSVSGAYAATANIPTGAQNLLLNSGFEDGLSSWNFSSGTAVYAVDSAAHSGANCAKGTETYSPNIGRFYQDVTNVTTVGNQYQISGWIKTSNVTGAVVIGLNYAVQGDYTPAGGYVAEIGYVNGTHDWAYYESPVFTLPPMPSDAIGLYFLFDFNEGTGTAWWDDVSLVSASVASTPQATVTPSPSVSSGAADSWSSFGHDLTSARYSAFAAPKTNRTLWTSTLDDSVRVATTVLGDTAYVASFSGRVYALEASTGKAIWNYTTGAAVWSSPTIDNGVVYVGSNDFEVYALNAATGEKIWDFPTGGGVFASPTVVDNVVYVGSTDNNFYALDAGTGAKIWNYTTDGQIRDTASVVNGVVYVGTQGGTLYALDTATGAKIWGSPTGDGDTYTNSSPAVVDGVVYVGSCDKNLYAFRASDGAELWTYLTNAKVSSSPAVFNGIVYFGSEDANLYAVRTSDGQKVWSQPTGGAVYSSPAVADGVVYVGSWGGSVYAFDAATGAPVWSYATGSGVFSAPTIAGSVMFIGSYDSNVYAFGTSYAPASAAPSTAPSSTSPTASATPTAKPTYTGSFTFRAWIDGSDYLYVQGGGAVVWYEHRNYNLPGMDGNANYSTYINGVAWQPVWNNSMSDKYVNYASPHPTDEWNITSLTEVQARNSLSVVEYPSASNNYTAKILLDDDSIGGADWYNFTLNWEAPQLTSGDITKTAWVPTPASGVAAGVVSVGAVTVAAMVVAAATSAPASTATGSFFDKIINKIRELLPDTFKKWLEDVVASKRKLKIEEKKRSPYLPTKTEAAVYIVSILISTFAFTYVKVVNFNQFLTVLPTFFATSILVSLARTYILSLHARRKGVWTEYRLWYFGVAMFLLSTLAFKVPFSSPTRTVYHSRNFTERLGGFLACAAVFVTLGFGLFFFALKEAGFALVGGTGLAMCLIAAFFETFPVKPMGGRNIYKYNKALWAGMFLGTLALYVLWILMGQ